MVEATVSRIDEALDKPVEELEAELPELLDAIEGQTRELIETDPEVFIAVVDRLDEIDIAEFATENPGTAERFQELLWTGVEIFVEYNPETVEDIGQPATVDFDADDSPLDGHVRIEPEEGRLTGGAGMTGDAEITLTGPADNLVGIVTGAVDPVQGFMSGEFDVDGDIGRATQLAQLFNTVADDGYESLAENLDD